MVYIWVRFEIIITYKMQVWTFFWKLIHIQQWLNHNMWCINAIVGIFDNKLQNNHSKFPFYDKVKMIINNMCNF
jgi:hypothetical protein